MGILEDLFGVGNQEEKAPDPRFELKKHFIAKNFFCYTTNGFKVPCYSSFIINIVNESDFLAAGMGSVEAQSSLVDEYLEEVLFPHLKATGFFTFFLNRVDSNGEIFHQHLSHFVLQKSNGEVELDLNMCLTREALASLKYDKRGCGVEILSVRIDLDNESEDIMMENFNKLGWDDRMAIISNPRFKQYEEWLNVTTRVRRLEILSLLFPDQITQNHHAKGYVITVIAIGGNIGIHWKFDKSPHIDRSGWSILGFRKKDGFGPDKWSETDNGILIVDSLSDGSTNDRLEQGLSYYYTFFLKHNEEKDGCVRFSVRIPTAAECFAAKSEMERVVEQRWGTNNHTAKLQTILLQIDSEREKRELFQEYRETETNKIKDRGLSPEREAEALEDLENCIDRVRGEQLS